MASTGTGIAVPHGAGRLVPPRGSTAGEAASAPPG